VRSKQSCDVNSYCRMEWFNKADTAGGECWRGSI